MTTLRVIVDDVVISGAQGRYSEELTRELIRTAPVGCQVSGIISAVSPQEIETVTRLLPGLTGLYRSGLARRELQLAWQHGFTHLPGGGMIHAPSLLAPLSRHDRDTAVGQQSIVTVHDAIAHTHPDALAPRQLNWQRAMLKRAFRYADAVIVPTHSVAQSLAEVFDFGERIRVIPSAVSTKLALPVDAELRAVQLQLPQRYVLASGSLMPHRGLEPLIQSLSARDDAGLPLLLIGSPDTPTRSVAEVARDAGVAIDRVRTLGALSDADLAVVISRASVFVVASVAEGFTLTLLEAFAAGTPVVHSDAASVVEVAADAGVVVDSSEPDSYAERLATAIATVVGDPRKAAQMSVTGRDRASAFSWQDSARQIWQLHADL
ncbi:MAG: glycosyltransferase family 4 protein [Microbacteriaceae bacterium]|nr:glycosyltransferase family 4 protein [Microbacteriaceae bacterium]